MSSEVYNPQVHDLLQIHPASLDSGCAAEPSWVRQTLLDCPWVVVRRAQLAFGLIAVGVRGDSRSDRWAASVGFELASGRKVTTEASDLDLVIRAVERIDAEEARVLLERTIGLEARVDVRVETPVCGFAFEEYVSASSAKILLRYPDGVRLGEDPWEEEA
jgi:phosphoribosyl-dephospho-CoA transferase